MPESASVEQAVSRAVRDNLERLKRNAEELRQAVEDLVASCSSSRPTNALPPMLRAQTAAASLAAALEVLSRFITSALQPPRAAAEEEPVRAVILPAPESAPMPSRPSPGVPTPMGESQGTAGQSAASPRAEAQQQSDMIAEGAPVVPPEMAVGGALPPVEAEETPEEALEEPIAERILAFDLANLSREEQEMHRRANRVAKVSMQDIKMLKPEQVRLGQQNKDICVRLRNEIEKARKEYDRRFRPILSHPVDYFYHWLVEILADGDPEALGEYPYSSPVLRR